MENRIQLRIREKIWETATALTLVLEPLQDNWQYQAGQFLTLIFNKLGAKEFRRSYSFSSTPGVDAFPTITIKKIPNGSATRYLVDQTKPGDILEAILPTGQFVLPTSNGAPRDVLLIGGGSGVTPLFSILKQVLYFETQSRVTLILANSNEQSIIFRQKLRNLSQQFYKRFQLIHFLSDTKDSIHNLRQSEAPAEIHLERISNALIEKMVITHLRFQPQDAQFFLCGPKNLMLKASQMLHYLQFLSEQIHQETFTIVAPHRPPSELYKDSLLQIQYHNQLFIVPLKGGQTILEAAENIGLELPYSCRSGICTACKSRCTGGEVEMYLPAGRISTKLSNNIVFTCVGYPLTEKVEVEIGF
jgi:ring-1,2-phenylacetyl-CoA epoxidase subunit PaaE